MENGIFETYGFQLEKAKQALKVAKELESQKRAQGARYHRTDEKTWKLKDCHGLIATVAEKAPSQ